MDNDFRFIFSPLNRIFKRRSGNPLDELLGYSRDRVAVKAPKSGFSQSSQKELSEQEKELKRLDKILNSLEIHETMSDLQRVEKFKKLSRWDVNSPDCFTIKNNWIKNLVVRTKIPEKLNLSPEVIAVEKEEQGVINQLLGSSQWTLTGHFSLGHSPTKVYLVRRVEERELHVLKVGHIQLIQAEWERFQQSEHWRTLPETAQLKNWFIPSNSLLGGLNYELAGKRGNKVETLGQYFLKKITSIKSAQVQVEGMNQHFESVINRTLECTRSAWDHRLPKRFSPVHTFDRMLPVNLEVRVPPRKPGKSAFCQIDGTGEFGDWSWLPPGTPVILSNFIVEEIKSKSIYLEVTLNVPASCRLLKEEPEKFRSHRIRLQLPLAEAEKYYEGQEIKQIIGDVIETRLTRFGRELIRLPDFSKFNLETKHIKVNSLGTFPNPFIILGQVLQEYFSKDRDVFVAEIHGDFHWHNIMVDREDGHLLAFVDLARVRYDYVLHDFFKLELSLITGLLKHPKSGGILDNAVQLYNALDQAWENNRNYGIKTLDKELQPLALAILKIRQEAAPFLHSRDHREYYAGLLVYLLSSLKFKSLDPAGKLAAFGAALVVGQLAAQLFENTKD